MTYSDDDGVRKVVGGVYGWALSAESRATASAFEYTWVGNDRFHFGASGKRTPKTGADYKAEIRQFLAVEGVPKKE